MGYISCKSDSSISVSNCQIQHAKVNPTKPQHFDLSDLEAATSFFSDHNFLGRGSHGCVYKAHLRSNTLVAVKKPSPPTSNEAENEINILSNLQNPRLVNLIGFTPDPEDRLLVIEFMSNGTLFDLLHSNPRPLNWGKRVQLALQTAKAIEFLHSLMPPVFHRDIKSANVLIDGDFSARLGDFGLAIRCWVDDIRVKSTPPAGTIGYLDPYYVTPDNLSTKSDVFSFGILLLEMISGRKAFDVAHSPHSIVDWAIPLVKKGRFLDVYDARIQVPKEMKKFALVAAKCVRSCRERRPTMKEVVGWLKGLSKCGSSCSWYGFGNPCGGGFSSSYFMVEDVCVDDVRGSINRPLVRNSRRVYSELGKRRNLLDLMAQTNIMMPEFREDDEDSEEDT